MQKFDFETFVKSYSTVLLREFDGQPVAKIYRKTVVCFDDISFSYVYVVFDGLDDLKFCFSSVSSCRDFYFDITPCNHSIISRHYKASKRLHEDEFLSLVHDYLLV